MPDDLGVSEADIDFSATEHVTDAQWRARGYDKCGCGEWKEPGRVTWCKVGLAGGPCGNRWCESCLKERLCAGIEALADVCMNRETCPECLLDIDKRDRLRRKLDRATAFIRRIAERERYNQLIPYQFILDARDTLREISR